MGSHPASIEDALDRAAADGDSAPHEQRVGQRLLRPDLAESNPFLAIARHLHQLAFDCDRDARRAPGSVRVLQSSHVARGQPACPPFAHATIRHAPSARATVAGHCPLARRRIIRARCTRACAALVRAASLANSLRWRLVSRMRGVDGQAIRPRYQPPLTLPLRTGPRNELPGGCTSATDAMIKQLASVLDVREICSPDSEPPEPGTRPILQRRPLLLAVPPLVGLQAACD